METQIIKIRFESLKNETHVQFHDNFCTLLEKQSATNIADMELTPLLGLYYPAFQKEKEALDVVLKSKYTLMLAEKDRERDEIYRGFVTTVKGLRYHFNPGVQQAAARVMDIFDHYGNIARRSNDDETAAINDIVREFGRTDLTADLNTLNVNDWLTRLIDENSAFDQLTHQRFEEAAAQTTARMKAARAVTDKYYRNIVRHLEYLGIIDRITPALTEFIRELNVIVTHYKNMLARG
jgi:hypothetical protein